MFVLNLMFRFRFRVKSLKAGNPKPSIFSFTFIHQKLVKTHTVDPESDEPSSWHREPSLKNAGKEIGRGQWGV